MEVIPTNLPDFEEPFPICLLTKSTKIPRDTTIYVLKFASGFIIQMSFSFLDIKIIRGFNSSLWLYVMLIHTPLDFHPEANIRLFTS